MHTLFIAGYRKCLSFRIMHRSFKRFSCQLFKQFSRNTHPGKKEKQHSLLESLARICSVLPKFLMTFLKIFFFTLPPPVLHQHFFLSLNSVMVWLDKQSWASLTLKLVLAASCEVGSVLHLNYALAMTPLLYNFHFIFVLLQNCCLCLLTGFASVAVDSNITHIFA